MPVLVEAISVIVQNETIAEKYPCGLAGYWMQCPNGTICGDEYIVRVGFMNSDDAEAFVRQHAHFGREAVDGPSVSSVAMALELTEGESYPVARNRIGRRELHRQHGVDGRGRQ